MKLTRANSFWLATLVLSACAHTSEKQLTASEHRAEAARHQAEAARQEAQFDPKQTRERLEPRTPFAEPGYGLETYNPTAEHLNEADRHMLRSFEHLKAAQKLEKFEDAACVGMTVAERSACPVLAPHLTQVEEIAQGLRLHLKPDAPAKMITSQMICHLAYANAEGFEKAPCPLYVKGIQIKSGGERIIELRSTDPAVAAEVRKQARMMFGAPASSKPVSTAQ